MRIRLDFDEKRPECKQILGLAMLLVLLQLPNSIVMADCDKYLEVRVRYERADAVALAEVTEVRKEGKCSIIGLSILRSWKGRLSSKMSIEVSNPDFLQGKEVIVRNYYLVYANLHKGTYQITTCFNLLEWDIAEKEISKLKSLSQCIDESKVNPTAICTMEYDPVCGCDDAVYGNRCQAENNGVRSWVSGECILY